jgi:hypothetical protein
MMPTSEQMEQIEQQMTICDGCGEEVYPSDPDECQPGADGLCIYCGKRIGDGDGERC